MAYEQMKRDEQAIDHLRTVAVLALDFEGCPEVSAAIERCDWSEVAIALHNAGYEDRWESLRAQLLAANAYCDC